MAPGAVFGEGKNGPAPSNTGKRPFPVIAGLDPAIPKLFHSRIDILD